MSERLEVAPYLESWRKRVAAERAAAQVRAFSALATAHRCAQMLSNEPGVRRVVLFGSLAGVSGQFREDSDIDLAVEGLALERYISVMAALDWELLPDLTVDLVRLEDASPVLKRRIAAEGQTLYERV